jgi:nicotinamide phosphoribosyltransferase
MSLQRTIKRKLQLALDAGNGALALETLKEMMPYIEKALDKPNNLILCSDAYKYSHHKFYPDKIEIVHSYLESRGGKFEKTVFYGLQIYLKKFLEGVAITSHDVDEAFEYLGDEKGCFGRDDVFDRTKFDYIVEKHGGKLPIRIKAVPEGTVVDFKNVLMTIENTDKNCAWLTNFLETILLQVWYPITVATLSREVKKIALKYFQKTTDHDAGTIDFLLNFVLNDFGFRGVSSVESAMNGGSAHLVNFQGSDTVIANTVINDVYHSKFRGMSIPATEHSIMTILGEDGEVDMMRRILTKFPTGMVACVSDSYNIFRACAEYIGGELKELILSRPSEAGNAFVVRPDSGDPAMTLKEVFKILFDKFGYTTNSKGYKVLPPQIRVIQGDGVNINSIAKIYAMLDDLKISAENLVFGMGGKLLQADINRDTQNFATKASFTVIDGVEHDVVKSPTEIDEHGNFIKSFKKSKSGRLKLVKTANGYETVTSKDAGYDVAEDIMIPVFENGVVLKEHTFEEVRERASVKVEELITVKEVY